MFTYWNLNFYKSIFILSDATRAAESVISESEAYGDSAEAFLRAVMDELENHCDLLEDDDEDNDED